MAEEKCPECGAPLSGVKACREYLNEMIKWDFEDFKGVGRVHHLTVLSYNLQHPSVYSPRGLAYAHESLATFLKNPTDYVGHGMHDREALGSDVRDWKIAGTRESHGSYAAQPVWTMTAADVLEGGLEYYVDNVKRWASSILASLSKVN